jgi:hypothetical protein
MITIGSLPVKTRLPGAAWVLAGLVTLFSLIQVNVESEHATPIAEQAKATYASVADLLGVFRAARAKFD